MGLRPLHFAAILLASVTATLARQQPPLRELRPFHGGVDLTSVTVTVRNADGQLVNDLTGDDFQVTEDGLPQTVSQFTHDRIPISLGMLVDTSDSMFGKRIEDARAAVDRFLFELLAADDEFFVMAFNHKPRILTTWTHDADTVRQALDDLKPSGSTALYDAVLIALPRLARRSRERGAIVVLSDGADTASDAALRDVTTASRSSDALIYAIAVDSPERQPINTRVNSAALTELTGTTGGRSIIVKSSGDLMTATGDIAEELNNQYLLGYVSSHGMDGHYHSIRVRLPGRDYKVRARTGYMATPQPVREPVTNRPGGSGDRQ